MTGKFLKNNSILIKIFAECRLEVLVMIAVPALLLALPAAADASQVKIVNGGYENVVVEISKSSAAGPPFPCSQFFANIEVSFVFIWNVFTKYANF